MSRTRERRTSPRANNNKRSGRNYQVGYGRPPTAHQFKPGRSGNPKGRPKGSKNEATILRSIFNRQIESRDGGRIRKISVLEGMLLKFAEDALKGNPKSATFLLNRYRLTEDTAPEASELDQDDRALLEAYTKTLQTKSKRKTQ